MQQTKWLWRLFATSRVVIVAAPLNSPDLHGFVG